MRSKFLSLATWGALALSLPALLIGANHREAPITALDHKADITDVYAFVSYGDSTRRPTPARERHADHGVDPLLEPANGPTLFPFDPDILYEIKIDNDYDAEEDISFQFRFRTDYRLPGVYTAVAGIGDKGAFAPGTETWSFRRRSAASTTPASTSARPTRSRWWTATRAAGPRIDELRRRRPSTPCPATPVRARWTTRRCSHQAHLRARRRHQGLRRHRRRSVLDRPRRGVRHRQFPHPRQRRSRRADRR